MTAEPRGVSANATMEPLDRRLHDIGWGLLLLTGMVCLFIIGASLVARPLLTKTT